MYARHILANSCCIFRLGNRSELKLSSIAPNPVLLIFNNVGIFCARRQKKTLNKIKMKWKIKKKDIERTGSVELRKFGLCELALWTPHTLFIWNMWMDVESVRYQTEK